MILDRIVKEWHFDIRQNTQIKYWSSAGARGVMVIVIEMDTAIRVQMTDETDCISHSTNTLGKGMTPIILPPAMGK